MRLTSVSVAISLTVSLCANALGQSDTSRLSSLPTAAQSRISAVLGSNMAQYRIQSSTVSLTAENPAQNLKMSFTGEGVEVHTPDAAWGIKLSSYGYGDARKNVEEVAPEATSNRVEYRRGSLVEWYMNGPVGLEQGFTIDQPPGKSNGKWLTMELQLSGNLTASLDHDGRSLTLSTQNGKRVLRYTGLSVCDALGKTLPVSEELRGHRLLLHIEDAAARYPVVVDPWVQLAELTSSDGVQGDAFGWSVSISGDAVVVGTPYATVNGNVDEGAAYVFVKPANGWTNMTQTAKLTASDGQASSFFGDSVAISGDTIVVGAPYYTPNAAYVFVKPASGWVDKTETAKLTAPNTTNFGESVAIVGNTVVVGSPSQNGAAYVFVKPESGWKTTSSFKAELTPSDGATDFGSPVSLSGNTIVVGSILASTGQGAAYVFVKPKGGWANMTQTAELTSSVGQSYVGERFGYSVSVSGNTVLVGAPHAVVVKGKTKYHGAAFLFEEPRSGWVNMTETAYFFTTRGPRSESYFGVSVVTTGSKVFVGAPLVGTQQQGAVLIFVKPAGGWKTTSRLDGRLAVSGTLDLGASVDVSRNIVITGAPGSPGAAYLFGQ
jgi:FG-GAP repeat